MGEHYDASYRQGYYDDVLDDMESMGYKVERRPDPAPEPIQETVSKKRGRGRPRLPLEEAGIDQDDDEGFPGLSAHRVFTARGKDISRRQGQNALYLERARKALPLDEWQDSVMAELGRLGDAQAMDAASERLEQECQAGRCSHRAHDRIALLRKWRLGQPRGDAEDLQEAIERVIRAYRTRYADVTEEMVAEALRRAYWAHHALITETVSEST